jgi:hypothetical protein
MNLNIKEIELLIQTFTADFCDYGKTEKDRQKYIESLRNVIGYTKKDLENIK